MRFKIISLFLLFGIFGLGIISAICFSGCEAGRCKESLEECNPESGWSEFPECQCDSEDEFNFLFGCSSDVYTYLPSGEDVSWHFWDIRRQFTVSSCIPCPALGSCDECSPLEGSDKSNCWDCYESVGPPENRKHYQCIENLDEDGCVPYTDTEGSIENPPLNTRRYGDPCNPEPLTCDDIYEDPVTCGSEDDPGNNCCENGDTCCQEDSDAPPVCCEPEHWGECLANLGINYCGQTGCVDPTPVPCGTRCCKAGQVCEHFLWFDLYPACAKPSSCDDDETLCHSFGNGNNICCKGNEVCTLKDTALGDIWGCNPNSCVYPDFLCRGVGEKFGDTEEQGSVNICCSRGTVCARQASGYPRCIEKAPEPITSPGGAGPGSIGGFSVYMYREAGSFSRNGIAYSFAPHGLRFNINAYLIINGVNANEQLYRYPNEDYFTDCELDILDSWDYNANSNPLTIDEGDFYLDIPENAISQNTLIEVKKLKISCAEVQPPFLFGDINPEKGLLLVIEDYFSRPKEYNEIDSLIDDWINNNL